MNRKTEITVYTKPACPQCTATTRWLDRRGIQYEVGDATDPVNIEAAKSMGITAAPVVVTSDAAWGGFQPHRLEAYAKEAA